MRSESAPEPLDLDRDLPTTQQDIEALRKCQHLPRLDFEEYLAFLESMPPHSYSELKARPGPRGDAMFDLLSDDE